MEKQNSNISKELYEKRRQEILGACRKLYEQRNFKDITIKEISLQTSISRPSIYNYFPTLESIFMEIFREEYLFWCNDMDELKAQHPKLTISTFADEMAKCMSKRPVLLKLLSMNIYDLEERCTLQELTSFKRIYKRALETVEALLINYFPRMSPTGVKDFILIFFPFMFGLYPYTQITAKQHEAMTQAGIVIENVTVYDFIYRTIVMVLSGIPGTKVIG